jgi:putative hydrolase of the HAD superfamily
MEYSKLKRKDNMIIFFDLDGTLLDHKSSEYLGVKEFYNYNKKYFKFNENEFYKAWCDISEKHFNIYLAGKLTFREQRIERIKELFRLAKIRLSDHDAEKKFNEYLLNYENSWKCFDDVKPCLDSLKDYRLGIISNGDLTQQNLKLEKMKIKSYFEIIITAGEVGISKPNVEIFKIAASKANVELRYCYYVGDDLNTDILPCKKVNMKGIFIDRNGIAGKIVDFAVINSLENLKNYIEG